MLLSFRPLRSSFTSWTVGLGLLPCCVNIWTGHPQKDRMADSKEKSDNPEKVADGMSALKIKQIEDEVASSYLLVDIGANLTNSKYSRDLDSVVERAKDAGISG